MKYLSQKNHDFLIAAIKKRNEDEGRTNVTVEYSEGEGEYGYYASGFYVLFDNPEQAGTQIMAYVPLYSIKQDKGKAK